MPGMAKTADEASSDAQAPKEVGRQLRHVRRKQGLSRSEVARSAGLTRRELAAYESGRAEVPESDLWCLAGSCGVDVSELLPNRAPVKVSSDLSLLAIGDSIRYLRNPVDDDEMLREYLAMIYELRNLPPGSRIPLRERDLMSLADALGGSPERIESRLVELIGMSQQEAARLRAMILPAPSLPAPTDAPNPASPYAQLADDGSSGGNGEVVDFFSAPRATDVFEPPPPPGPMPETFGWGDAPETPHYVPVDPISAVAPPVEVIESFNSRRGPAVDAPMPVDPFAAPTPGPMVFEPEPSPTPFGYLVDEPIARDWPAHAPPTAPPPAPPSAVEPLAAEPLVDDLPTVGWVMDAPAPPQRATAPFVPEPPAMPAAFGSTTAQFDGPIDAPPDAEPLPRRLPLSSATVAPPVAPAESAESAAEHGLDPPEPAPPLPATPLAAPPVSAIVWNAGTAAEVEPPVEPPIASLAATPPAAGAAAPAFERAGSNWRVGGIFPATAMADDGALALRRADARWALADVDAPGDFTLEAVVDFTAGAGFGVLFRATVDDHERVSGYSFDIDPIAGGGGYLVRQWEDNRQHWRPLAQAGVTDPTLLFGRHTVSVSLRADQLTVVVDGETVLSVPALSRCSIELGRQPCRGPHVGVQAWATTEVTIDSFRVAQH